MKGIPLYLIGAGVVFLIWRAYNGRVAPGTVFGRIPGLNTPGNFVVNADISQAKSQTAGVFERVPTGVRFQAGIDSQAGSR